ncbi:23S rRNA (pseudouridine(1915)-N(3))-methyltransferase RlmH [Candidatus Cyanaurora vandensis]|uniref:23S rRNA (pseudouridine(1915)-N(3))-methyltransferase RlmH n=1 Tax=Candidatus Cyanaurora vandensis TaxID=2714958 RepID=UPI002580E6ED|nr:23S rRNA (pseudouridine(1915)-N(3))-methyltransferase RlmH [Candidatus Cyanaurora vandensis]
MWQILALGNLTPQSLYGPASQEYLKRIQRYRTCELIELKPSRGSSVNLALRQEAQRLLPYLRPAREIVVLDERGAMFTTLRLSQWLGERAELTFVLGSAWGLAPEVKALAQHQLALSTFTLPHELARVVLLEQLYRALSLQAGHPYHHA